MSSSVIRVRYLGDRVELAKVTEPLRSPSSKERSAGREEGRKAGMQEWQEGRDNTKKGGGQAGELEEREAERRKDWPA